MKYEIGNIIYVLYENEIGNFNGTQLNGKEDFNEKLTYILTIEICIDIDKDLFFPTVFYY